VHTHEEDASVVEHIDTSKEGRPDPVGGAYSAPPDHLTGGEDTCCPLPKNPASDLRAWVPQPGILLASPLSFCEKSHC